MDTLEKSGCEQVSQEKLTGKLREDLGRRSAFVRSGGGNVLIVLKLARSLKNLTPCEYMAKQNQDVYIDLAAVNLLNGHPKSVIAMQ